MTINSIYFYPPVSYINVNDRGLEYQVKRPGTARVEFTTPNGITSAVEQNWTHDASFDAQLDLAVLKQFLANDLAKNVYPFQEGSYNNWPLPQPKVHIALGTATELTWFRCEFNGNVLVQSEAPLNNAVDIAFGGRPQKATGTIRFTYNTEAGPGQTKDVAVAIGDSPEDVANKVAAAFTGDLVGSKTASSGEAVYVLKYEPHAVEYVYCVHDGYRLWTHKVDLNLPAAWITAITQIETDLDNEVTTAAADEVTHATEVKADITALPTALADTPADHTANPANYPAVYVPGNAYAKGDECMLNDETYLAVETPTGPPRHPPQSRTEVVNGWQPISWVGL